MIDVVLRFKTETSFILFLILVLANCLWAWCCLKKKQRISLLPYILINALLLLVWWRLVGIDMDETEHLHCAWLVSQGLTPYRDFWQHHSPLLWLILSPLIGILKPTVQVFELGRILAGLISLASCFLGWQIAKKVWHKQASVSLYLVVVLAGSITAEFLFLRPDTLANLFLLAGLYFTLKTPEQKRHPLFLAGACFGMAASFILKQYLLFFLPILVIFFEKNKPRILNTALYCSGLAAGCLPLFWYLLKNNILKDFIYWVYTFNRQRLVVSVALPVAVACLAAWAGFLLFVRWQRSKDTKPLILLAALLLSTASSLTGVASVGGGYYLAIWFILSAAAASGCDINAALTRQHSLIKKSVSAGVILSLLIAPNFFHTRTHKDHYLNEDKRAIARLMKYCAEGTCLLLLPLNPVFSHDATRLYSDWQYLFLSQFPDVKLDIKSENTADRIISNRPAVIAYYFDRKWVLLDFMLKGLISKEDFRKLSTFLQENYTTDWTGENKYYIRKDRY